MNSEDFRNRKNKIVSNLDDTIADLEKGCREAGRVRNVVENTGQILDDLDEQFCKQTGLTATDVTLLFLVTGLQIARQYLLSNEKCRLSAAQGDKAADTVVGTVSPNWKEVLTQSVPYDSIKTGNHISNTGLGGTTHRYRALGHDPILGWFFGSANIMTNSLTKTDFETYQVKYMKIIRHYPLGVAGMLEKAICYSVEEPRLLAASVARQAIHFGSDYFTKQGLPVPLIATVNNELAQKMLTKWHIDMWNVTRGMALATFINFNKFFGYTIKKLLYFSKNRIKKLSYF